MKPGIYRHPATQLTCDIEVLKVYYQCDKYVKIKIRWVSRASGNYQYVGKGQDGYTYTEKLYKPNQWYRIG